MNDVIFLVGMFGTLFARWMLDDVYLGVGKTTSSSSLSAGMNELWGVGSVSLIIEPYRDGRFELY